MHAAAAKRLIPFIVLYATASLVHFIHNAEFLAQYPNLPSSWTRMKVYLAWLGITAIGALGLWLLQRGFTKLGLLTLAVYALFDSLGHYVVAAFSSHTAAMNFTILFEVGAATSLLVEVLRLGFRRIHPYRNPL